jgi:pimeloyl-ACP methyl ester carboxylesterase
VALVALAALTLALVTFGAVEGWAVAPAGRSSSEVPLGLADAGPHEVATLEVEVPRTRGGEGSFGARVFAPIPIGGAVASPSPAVAFGHGYLADVGWYESTLAHLASWGVVVIAPRSAGGPFPDHAAFAGDLLSALDWVVAEAERGTAWPGGAVDAGALGLSGHSMGGGAAVLAAARAPDVRAIATLAAAETDPSAIAAVGDVTAPALFVAAGDDAITTVAEHQRPMFEAKTQGPAQLRTILGASHCGFLDRETILLDLVCDQASIDADEQQRITREVLTAWLRYELAGDARLAGIAWPQRPDVTTLVESR